MRIYNIKKKVILQKDEKGFGTYFEVPYIDYRTNGSIYTMGTEDFTRERYNKLVRRTIYLPTGKTNKRWAYDMGRSRNSSVRFNN